MEFTIDQVSNNLFQIKVSHVQLAKIVELESFHEFSHNIILTDTNATIQIHYGQNIDVSKLAKLLADIKQVNSN